MLSGDLVGKVRPPNIQPSTYVENATLYTLNTASLDWGIFGNVGTKRSLHHAPKSEYTVSRLSFLMNHTLSVA